jgi:transposase
MTKVKKAKSAKESTLISERCLNLHPEHVHSKLFRTGSFFDARDLVQVKYEMLREVEKEGTSITKAAADFGMSRPSFYQAKQDFEAGGIPGLTGQKRGPKGAHKVTGEVLEFIEEALKDGADLKAMDLVTLVHKRFGTKIHPRSIERALERKKKITANAKKKA